MLGKTIGERCQVGRRPLSMGLWRIEEDCHASEKKREEEGGMCELDWEVWVCQRGKISRQGGNDGVV